MTPSHRFPFCAVRHWQMTLVYRQDKATTLSDRKAYTSSNKALEITAYPPGRLPGAGTF